MYYQIAFYGTTRRSKRTFGWTVTMVNNNTLWWGTGEALGNPMSTFRAHAYGYMAAISFFARFSEYYGIPINMKSITVITDQPKLVKRIIQYHQQTINKPGYCSDQDYDVILQIDQRLAHLKPTKIVHVIKHPTQSTEAIDFAKEISENEQRSYRNTTNHSILNRSPRARYT